MLTRAAADTRRVVNETEVRVFSRAELLDRGCSDSQIRARLAAGRWQRVGRAIVLHNAELTKEQRWRAGVLNCGPRAVLASFSAGELLGLRGWERDEVHVLAPVGVAAPRIRGLPVVLHRTSRTITAIGGRHYQPMAPALLLAATAFRSPRPACGILAAGVQQRLVSARELHAALSAAGRAKHRRILLAAVHDIGMGAQALSEIDFVALCRRQGLPRPALQTLRTDASGHRRYLDAEWRRADGVRVVVEVDGALHLNVRRWWDDQLRQNEITLGNSIVLRFPSVVIRTEERLVAGQLRRALMLGS